MAEFKITGKRITNDILLINVAGFLDAYTFERLENAINSAFKQNIYKIVVNMEHVDYISSAGAGVFIGALSKTHEKNGNIVILKPTDNVKEVFNLLGLTLIFTIVEDINAAVAAFN